MFMLVTENKKHDLKRCISGITAAAGLLKMTLKGEDLQTVTEIIKECEEAFQIIDEVFITKQKSEGVVL